MYRPTPMRSRPTSTIAIVAVFMWIVWWWLVADRAAGGGGWGWGCVGVFPWAVHPNGEQRPESGQQNNCRDKFPAPMDDGLLLYKSFETNWCLHGLVGVGVVGEGGLSKTR